jgi:hypothetical protein
MAEDDLLRATIAFLVFATFGLSQTGRFDRVEKPLLRAALLAHGAAAFVHILIMGNLIDGGDLFSYTRHGGRVADLLRSDLGGNAYSVLQLLFHQTPNVDLGTSEFEGSSTGAMVGLSAWCTYLTGGSVYTLGVTISMAAYFGQVALYEALKHEFPQYLHRRLLIAAMLVPSVIFWSSALLKEAVVTVGLGHAVLGMVRTLRGASKGSIIRLLLGALPIAMTKPYILFGFVLAGAIWIYAETSRARPGGFKAGYVLLALVVGMVGLMGLGNLFPEYAMSGVMDRAVTQRALSAQVEGSSNFGEESGPDVTPEDMPFSTQVAYAPMAILTAIFRPSLLDARSPQVAANAIETTILLFLTLRALRRRGIGPSWSTVATSPMLMFALVFSLILALGVGLSTSNFGTLSRYRMPLVSFFWALVLVLDVKNKSDTATSPAH